MEQKKRKNFVRVVNKRVKLEKPKQKKDKAKYISELANRINEKNK